MAKKPPPAWLVEQMQSALSKPKLIIPPGPGRYELPLVTGVVSVDNDPAGAILLRLRTQQNQELEIPLSHEAAGALHELLGVWLQVESQRSGETN